MPLAISLLLAAQLALAPAPARQAPERLVAPTGQLDLIPVGIPAERIDLASERLVVLQTNEFWWDRDINADGRLGFVVSVFDIETGSLVTAYEKIRFLSITDPLTDTYNRTYINNRLPEEIAEALARGDRVELRGFGAFSTKHRKARQGRNPRTGAPVDVPEKFVPFFKAGKGLRERLNADG